MKPQEVICEYCKRDATQIRMMRHKEHPLCISCHWSVSKGREPKLPKPPGEYDKHTCHCGGFKTITSVECRECSAKTREAVGIKQSSIKSEQALQERKKKAAERIKSYRVEEVICRYCQRNATETMFNSGIKDMVCGGCNSSLKKGYTPKPEKKPKKTDVHTCACGNFKSRGRNKCQACTSGLTESVVQIKEEDIIRARESLDGWALQRRLRIKARQEAEVRRNRNRKILEMMK